MKQWIWLFLAIATAGCSPNREAQLQVAAAFMDGHADSALYVLNSISEPHTLTTEAQARYAVLLCTAHQKQNISLCEDSLILPALSYYRQQGDTANIETASRLAAYYHYDNKRTEEAEQLLNAGLKLAQARGDKEQMVAFYHSLGEISNNNNTKPDSEKILKYLRPCLDLRQNPDDYFYYGMFLAMNRRDSADYFVDRAIAMAYEKKDERTGRYLHNYASYLIRERRLDNALQVLNRMDSIKLQDNERQQSYLHKARIYLLQSKLDKARNCLEEMEQLPIERNIISENSRLQLLNLINYTENRDIDLTTLGRYNDSVYVSILNQNSSLMAKTETKNKLIQQYQSLQIERQRLLLFFICLFAIIIGIWLYMDNRRKQSIIRLQQKLDQNRAELIRAQNRLSESDVQPIENMQQIYELRLEKIKLCKESFAHTLWNKRLATMNCQTATTELTGKESSELTEVLTRCFADVMIDLKQECPKLNSEELLYCIFLLLECSNRTISLCTFTAEGTIRTRKTRMKEKLSDNYLAILFQLPFSATG